MLERLRELFVKDEEKNWYHPDQESTRYPGNPIYHLFLCKYDTDLISTQSVIEIWADGTFAIKHKQYAQVLIFHIKIVYDIDEDRFISFPFLF